MVDMASQKAYCGGSGQPCPRRGSLNAVGWFMERTIAMQSPPRRSNVSGTEQRNASAKMADRPQSETKAVTPQTMTRRLRSGSRRVVRTRVDILAKQMLKR